MRRRSSPSWSAASSGSHFEPQITLITFQPAPRKTVSSSWMILPLPRTGPSRRCRLQLTTKTRLSSRSRPASEIAPSDSGSSVSPSPRNAHTLRPDGVLEPAALEVLHEPRLVDRHDRPEAHRDGRELPEVRHQPRVRIRRDAVARHLLAEAEQVLLRQPALEEGAGVDARRGVALHVDQVAAVLVRRGAPEVVEADLVQRRGRLVAGDVPAELGGLRVRAQHGGHRVPADDRPDAVLELEVARELVLPLHRDGVDVCARLDRAVVRAGRAGVLEHAVEQLPGALRAVVGHHRVERLDPLECLLPIDVAVRTHGLPPLYHSSHSSGSMLAEFH